MEEAKLRSTEAAARKTVCEEGVNYWTKVVEALDKDNDGKVFVGEYQKLPTRRKRGVIEIPKGCRNWNFRMARCESGEVGGGKGRCEGSLWVTLASL